MNIKSPKKLIEVALPLDAINGACSREKSIRHDHPSTLHLWWARPPLAAARAVIFSQLVNDTGTNSGKGFKYGMNKKDAAVERKRLFKITDDFVKRKNSTNGEVLERARAEIRRSWREVCELNKNHPQAAELFNPDKLPSFHDPFTGGGAIPLEAQRVGWVERVLQNPTSSARPTSHFYSPQKPHAHRDVGFHYHSTQPTRLPTLDGLVISRNLSFFGPFGIALKGE